MMILEATVGGPWAQGGSSTVNELNPAAHPHLGPERPFGSRHVWQVQTFAPNRIGAFASMADGSYRFIRDDAAPEILEALATIRGGETLPAEW